MTVAFRSNLVYQDVIEFLAAGVTSQQIVAFQPSSAAKERVGDLIEREKTSGLSAEEKTELDHYLELEHIMRLAKARARWYLSNEPLRR